jgi:hypothetical protein
MTPQIVSRATHLTVGLSLSLVVLSCGKDSPTQPGGTGIPMYGVTFDNRLLHFTSDAPGVHISDRAITGLAAGQRLVSIDFRPADGELYGVGTDNIVYRVNPSTAGATAVGAAIATAITGEHFGLAFDPVTDQIRTSSVETDQNLRINAATGALTAVDTDYSFAAADANFGDNPSLAALAFTNSTAGAGSTVLYGIESGNDVLVRIDNPSSGVLTTIGPLGTNTVPCTSFDIDARNGAGWATLADNGVSRLFRINLATGVATLVGTILDGPEVQGLAIADLNCPNCLTNSVASVRAASW